MYLVVLVVDHLRDEGPRLGAPGLGAGHAGRSSVSGSAPGGLVAATQKLQRKHLYQAIVRQYNRCVEVTLVYQIS